MAEYIAAMSEQTVTRLPPEVTPLAAIRPIDLSPPQGNTDPQTHVLVSLTG